MLILLNVWLYGGKNTYLCWNLLTYKTISPLFLFWVLALFQVSLYKMHNIRKIVAYGIAVDLRFRFRICYGSYEHDTYA